MNRARIEASIVVPCFEAARTLDRCLASLIDQEASVPYEILVVENGSPDATRAVANAAASRCPDLIRLLDEPVPGAYGARNRGLRESRGGLVLFTDADCTVSHGWLRGLVAAMDDPGTLLAGGEIEPDPGQRGFVARHAARSGILTQAGALSHPRGPYLQTANLAVRREDALAAGGFDATLYSGGDADFCWRLHALHPERRIRRIAGAPVIHLHRETLPGLWRQFRRYGQADVALTRRHGLLLVPAVVKLGADTLRILLAPVLSFLLIPVTLLQNDLLTCLDPLLRSVRILARRAGQLSAWLFPGRARRQ